MSDPSERALLERCRRGDRESWAELYRLHAGRVERFVRLGAGDGPDIPDLVQEVFIELLRSLGSFREDSALSTWLYRIARGVVMRSARAARRRRTRERVAFEIGAAQPEAAPAPLRRLVARQDLERVAQALAELAPGIRLVWVMREIEGLDAAETARALGITRVTVRTRFFRARRRILAALGRDDEAPVTGALRSEVGR